MPHQFQMPKKHVDRMIDKLGREHVQETFETNKTALVVVDMQNYFIDEGQMSGCPMAQTIVDNINKIAKTVRETQRYRHLDSKYGTKRYLTVMENCA